MKKKIKNNGYKPTYIVIIKNNNKQRSRCNNFVVYIIRAEK